jgi:hypothetical protein
MREGLEAVKRGRGESQRADAHGGNLEYTVMLRVTVMLVEGNGFLGRG